MLFTFTGIFGLVTALYGRGGLGLVIPFPSEFSALKDDPSGSYRNLATAHHQPRDSSRVATSFGPVDNPCMTPQMPHPFCANTYDTLTTTSSDGDLTDMEFFTAQLMTFAQTTNNPLGAGATDSDDMCLGTNDNVICCNSPSADTTSGSTTVAQAARILSGAIQMADTSSTDPDHSHDGRSRFARRDSLAQVFVNQPNVICSVPVSP